MSEGGSDAVRVAFIGNVANSQYRAVVALRRAGVDAHLYISSSDGPSSRPENDDPELLRSPPEWLHEGDWINAVSVVAPWRSAIAAELSHYDVVVASGPGPIFAQFAGVPWCFFVTGGDLTVKPFPVAFWRWYPDWRHRGAELVAGAWQRRAVRRADRVWLQQFSPTVDAADRLRIRGAARSERYFPMVVDCREFTEARSDPDYDEWAADVVGDSDFVVFHPSRLVMEATPKLVRTGQWKGNDVLLRGFASLVRDHGAPNATLVLPDTGQSRDRAAARHLLSELGVSDRVRWVEPDEGEILNCAAMAALYRRSDVVADEFGIGWFGYVTLEGLATARPVLCNIDESVMTRMYPWHPICKASTVEEVASQLDLLRRDPEQRRTIGARGRQWVLDHHAPDTAASVYFAAIDELASMA